MPFLVLLLLTSHVSNAENFSAVQVKLRVYLPPSIKEASVGIKLVEQRPSHNISIISKQNCSLVSGDSCAISLPYKAKNIDQNRQYYVNVSVISQADKTGQIYLSSFPVLTFDNPNALKIIISIPPEPIE